MLSIFDGKAPPHPESVGGNSGIGCSALLSGAAPGVVATVAKPMFTAGVAYTGGTQ